jgi:gluconate 2-dehydrogenase gamma chain
MNRPTRRQFVASTALGFGTYVLTVVPGCRRRRDVGPTASTRARSPHGGFDVVQAATVAALVERVLPADEDPGALELGVPAYLDRALADPEVDFLRRPFMTLVDGVEKQARARHGRGFADLTAEHKDALLGAWQKGRPGEQRSFEVLLALTFEGAFGDPKYGGNRDGRGYAMVGFLPGPVLPRLPVVK